ncbi:hypothetical protein [Streptomyces canus]|uniref:hypothetical protein n=1 Tax=Streptomyces canus TaxID=58343 RepID=UPI0036E3FFF9
MEDRLLRSGGAVISQAAGMSGLGGVGKTALALQCAHAGLGRYRLAWWIVGETEGRISSGLGELALRLHPAWAREATAGERAEWALTWLETHSDWLLVYDNGSQWVSDANEVSILARKYATLRTQALTIEDSRSLLDRLLGEL